MYVKLAALSGLPWEEKKIFRKSIFVWNIKENISPYLSQLISCQKTLRIAVADLRSGECKTNDFLRFFVEYAWAHT